MILLLFVLLQGFFHFIHSECPNGCSGNGDCGNRDQCTCYIGYTGNDCSEHTCPFGYAHVDTPKGDLNFDQTLSSSLVAISTALYPHGTTEDFPASALAKEAHFYMECSNNGICDRTSGLCTCFPAYEGHACQRQECPNGCSKRGTCETMSTLATKASGTLFGKMQGYGDTTYDLWDADLIQACRCDPGYTGADCSQRQCKVGVDPLYDDRNDPIYDQFFLSLGTDGTVYDTTLSSFRLRVFDYRGESYLTSVITVPTAPAAAGSSCALCTPLQAAVVAIPNSPFPDFECTKQANSAIFTARVGATPNLLHLVACTFTGTPGALRLPELVDVNIVDDTSKKPMIATSVLQAITATTLRGEDADFTPTYAGIGSIANAAVDTTSVTLTTTFTPLLGADAYYLIRIANQYLALQKSTMNVVWGWPLAALAKQRIYYAPTGTLAIADEVKQFKFGDTVITTNSATTVFSRGDWVFYQNQIFRVLSVAAGTGSSKLITIDRPFFGVALTGADVTAVGTYLFKIVPPSTAYTYVGDCAFKGLCDGGSGLCKCFKGYSGDNCASPNALAV